MKDFRKYFSGLERDYGFCNVENGYHDPQTNKLKFDPGDYGWSKRTITDKDYQELEAQAKDSGLTLLGFYHTHPDSPSVPSETDLAYAWPFFSYIILSVNNRKADTINSYVLDLDSSAFKEEQLQIEG